MNPISEQSELPKQPEQSTAYRKPRPLKQRNILTRSSSFGPNMTPMVDVTLVILIFFMASASIGGLEWFLKTQLPETQDPDLQSSGYSLPTPMLHADIFIENDAVLVRGFGDEPTPIETVIQQINRMNPVDAAGFILGIRASDDVPYEAIVQLHDAASALNMRVAIR